MADYVLRQRRLRFLNGLPLDTRIFRDRANPLENFDRDEIRERYRFYPETIIYLCDLVDIDRGTERSHALPPLLLTLVSLQFFASNAHHIVIAQVHGVSRVSVSRAITAFCDSLTSYIRDFVKFPSALEQESMMKKFYAVAGFPNVIGAIDGTHIRIQGPSQHEEDFVNRKGFHSVNVQMICDATFKFVNVVAKWPGSVHDARIWRESLICFRFERGEFEGVLLGDSGYPCKKHLLTPYLAPQTPAQERYNNSLCKTRVLVEQSFGVLKRRFPCLSYGLRMKPHKSTKVIAACVILHNIGIDKNDVLPRTCDDSQPQFEVEIYNGPGTGSHYRDYIATAFFS